MKTKRIKKLIFLSNLIFMIFISYGQESKLIFSKSIADVEERYSLIEDKSGLVDHFKSISMPNSVREVFFEKETISLIKTIQF